MFAKNIISSFSLLFLVIGCDTTKKSIFNPVTDIPKDIIERFGVDMVPNEEMALKIADIIFKEQYPNTNFDKLKPYTIKLVANNKVWEIIASTQKIGVTGIDKTYFLRINKNTGEILNLWVKR